MKVLDVNVLVNALRSDTPQHEIAFDLLDRARTGREPVVILTEVAAGFVRIVTRPGLFANPEDADSAMAALRAWCSGPRVRVSEAGAGRWHRFERLMARHDLVGADVHDGLLAAACLDLSATLVTFDRGFTRFEELELELL